METYLTHGDQKWGMKRVLVLQITHFQSRNWAVSKKFSLGVKQTGPLKSDGEENNLKPSLSL